MGVENGGNFGCCSFRFGFNRMTLSRIWTVYCLVQICSACFAVALARTDKETEFKKGKICIGTNFRLSVPSNREHHYRNLRDRYANCTYVDGNLEITWLPDEVLDLSFLQYIREVTGYVLVSHVDVHKVVLPSLQIIRGRTLFKINVHDDEFALIVILSKMYNLEMPALRDVLNGSVGIMNNYNLCHVKSIRWDEIMTGQNSKYIYMYNFTNPERECPSCDKSCEGGCWGEGAQNCQKFSKVHCSPQCHNGRCFGSLPRECCHLFCAGGCTGPKQHECLACRNFYDDGVCKDECPPMQRYNPDSFQWERNPDGKYAYGATCVKTCPDHLLKDSGACVRVCPPKNKPVNGECLLCDGPCPKTCVGDLVHAGNINNFTGCTIIEGSLTILDTSFAGFQQVYANFSFGPRYPPMNPSRLEVFSTLKEVTGYLNIQASHPDFLNLSFFRNLEVIGGRHTTEFFSALYIVKTSLQSLNLRSLKKIRSGSVTILENSDLCFAENINWRKLMRSHSHNTMLQNNRLKTKCLADGQMCSSQCSDEGCWGQGTNECLSCANYSLNDTCIDSCDFGKGMYFENNKVCKYCSEECELTCTGPGPGNCTKCKNVMDGPYCVPSCPSKKYNDKGECKECHEFCIYGCTGPENFVGEGGCNSCEKAVVHNNDTIGHCLRLFDPCPEKYYQEWVGPQETGPLKAMAGQSICKECHPRCKACSGYGFHLSVCTECVHYRSNEQCEEQCPSDHYADEDTHTCRRCSNECRECYGPDTSQCVSCRNYRIAISGNLTHFNCTASCPLDKPHKFFPKDSGDPYCSDVEPNSLGAYGEDNKIVVISVIVVIVCVFLLGLICIIIHQCYKNKYTQSAVKMSMRMSGFEDEPLKPSNVKPNLAKLRIVKEAELRKGAILGYGAFGTVYKGVWVPEGENVKIPVAIKVLREGTSTNTNKEILEEAYIMASVEHPNLLQLLAVCMTSQMMLVTQLMPLGCLLEYVRNNRDKIGSKPLLNWCTQIARGMAYLEERRLVHRDLAARNVLVQTPGCVRITDFGLAKLLDTNQDEYKAAGGKMPIKWLALECIQHRIFTHKSDVWAFGVTVWELVTYGARPYENIPAREVPDLLEKGERLHQPSICSIEIYMIMIKCWMLDAESRPSFKELADEFAKMSRDPGRYLVIPGDKLMRLPSYTQQDEKELIKKLSEATDNGPETIMVAEEYLQPKARNHFAQPPSVTGESMGHITPPADTPTRKFMSNPLEYDIIAPQDGTATWGGNSIGVPIMNHPAMISHRLANTLPPPVRTTASGLLESNFDSGIMTSNGSMQTIGGFVPGMGSLRPVPNRYSSDPLNMLNRGDEAILANGGMTMNGHPMGPYARRFSVKGSDLRMGMPVDEDDYLMPSSQPAAYMDLIDSKTGSAADVRNSKHLKPFIIPASLSDLIANKAIDNPEYLLNNGLMPCMNGPLQNGIPLTGTAIALAGIPVSVNHNGLPEYVNTRPVNGLPVLRRKNTSSEEDSSDHEYYNDFDRLKKELQPLNNHRNETTV